MTSQLSPSRHALQIAIGLTVLFALIIGWGTLSPPGPPGPPLLLSDKQLHFLAFLVLVLPLGWVRPRWMLGIIGIALAYGAAIELIQPSVGRSAEWADLMADGLGILVGVVPGQVKHRFRTARG